MVFFPNSQHTTTIYFLIGFWCYHCMHALTLSYYSLIEGISGVHFSLGGRKKMTFWGKRTRLGVFLLSPYHHHYRHVFLDCLLVPFFHFFPSLIPSSYIMYRHLHVLSSLPLVFATSFSGNFVLQAFFFLALSISVWVSLVCSQGTVMLQIFPWEI